MLRVLAAMDRPSLSFGVAFAVAAVLWLLLLTRFAGWLNPGREPANMPAAIEMRLVETPPPAPSPPPQQPLAAAAPHPAAHEHSSAPKPSRMTQASPHVTPQAPPQQVQAPLSAPVQHESPISSEGHTASSRETSNNDAAPTRSTGQSGVMQARVLSQPLPVLPDDLREVAYRAVAVAHFVVHVDGTFDVELIKPTQNPRLNQILLETLRTWRFFPAMENGSPVESHQDVRVHFNVD